MIQRSGEVLIQMRENVKQVTIKPFIETVIVSGTKVFTDEMTYIVDYPPGDMSTKQ